MKTVDMKWMYLLMAFSLLFAGAADAGVTGGGTGVTGDAFQGLYTFVYEAATGYLGRSIAIIGGMIGLGMGAATGKALPAIIGIILAVFGAIGPSIINTIFMGAII